MKGTLFTFLALFFPWVVFFWEGRPMLGVGAMVLQATLVGWLPMTVIAFKHRDQIDFFQKKVNPKSKSVE